MHPIGVASAAWVFASAPSRVPFYVAGGLLACWAVVLSATGLTHPDFPGSARRARMVMLISVLLAAATLTTAVATASRPSATGGGGAPPSGAAPVSNALQLAADPSGKLAYDKKQVTVNPGNVAIRFVNRSPLPHNVTIAKGTRVVAHTKTIQGATATATAKLPAGHYVFYCSVDAHRQGGMQGTLTDR